MSEQEKNQTPRRPYSYHTFIFPFLYQDGTKNVSRKDFTRCLHKGFEQDIFMSQPGMENTVEYSRFRYFNRAARNAIYTTQWNDEAVVWNYRFNIESIARNTENAKDWVENEKGCDNPARMVIKKGKFQANLAVNGIRLKLFDTGVGMLIFELENYELSDENSVIIINEYGRRVFMPYVIPPDGICYDCADEVILQYGNETPLYEDARISGGAVGKTDEIILSPVIRYLLTGEKTVTTVLGEGSDKFYIEPIIDDRMFVACIYSSSGFVGDMGKWDAERKNYCYISDPMDDLSSKSSNAATRFYKMVFVDKEEPTCKNRVMLSDLNREHSYARWIEQGTMTGITEYSMVCITNDVNEENHIHIPFLTEYVEMVLLVLAQRASLLAFERAISEVTCKKKFKMDVEKIHRRYVAFESELLLSEVTSQQQGIELYDMMLKNLFIGRLTDDLDNQINSLYELHTADHEGRENKLLNFLAVIGAAEIFGNLGSDLVNALLPAFCENPIIVPQWPFTVGIGVVGMITLWLLGRHSNSVK